MSIKCPSCGLVNFAKAEKCKRCKEPLLATPEAKVAQYSKSSEFTPYVPPPEGAAHKSSDAKTLLKLLPFAIFGVPMFLALKDRIFNPPVIVGSYTDTFELIVLAVCALGLILTTIILLLTRKQ